MPSVLTKQTDGTYLPVSADNPLPMSSTTGKSIKVTVTRPNDTTAYAAGDVIGSATGSTAALTFAGVGTAGQLIRILSAKLRIDVSAIPSGMTNFTLHLYNVTPPSALGDNTAWDLPSGDRASYLGNIVFDYVQDKGSTLYAKVTDCDEDVLLSSSSIFAYLVTNAAYTPTAQAVKSITINAMGV